jgi:aspartate kinase
MKTVVQKYGGTSLGKADRMLGVAEIVKESLKKDRVILALSAMSSYVKAEGTTSRLLEAAETALAKKDFSGIVGALENNHLSAINELMKGDFRGSAEKQIREELRALKSFLGAISVIGELSSRSQDVIIGTGEKLSACIFAHLLNSMGIEAEYVDLSSIVDRDFTETNQQFYAYIQGRLKERIKACGSRVPVLTGYFGFVPGGIIASIGRGYTDFTAALAAAATGARELQIWKEVDGVYSADPRKVENAKVLPAISPEEAAELTYFGSEVIHPFTMEQVIKANIPIRIKNTFKPDLPGTIVDPNAGSDAPGKPVTAVTVKRNVTVININSNRMLMAYGFLAKIFNIFAKYGIIVDMIATSEVNISMTVENIDKLNRAMSELEELGRVTVNKNMAILSLVGKGQRHCVGLAGRMFSVLGSEKINIEMISQGASEINVSCIIEDQSAEKAMKVIHREFLE